MEDELYYQCYEHRYKTVYIAGAERWGHSPDDSELNSVLKAWVFKNNLIGKRIIEFACGEGACGVILSKLGCIYHGVDIAPSAIAKSRSLLATYPNARISVFDMVKEPISEQYDAALDVMGFHMLVTDSDRSKYLENVLSCLKNGSPMLFYKECYRLQVFDGVIDSFEKYVKITNSDYTTLQRRTAVVAGKEVEIYIPFVPARAKNEELYVQEMIQAGFIVDEFEVNEEGQDIQYSANIYVHKE